MKTFTEFLMEKVTQEEINKKIELLSTLTDEQEIIKLKSDIESLQKILNS